MDDQAKGGAGMGEESSAEDVARVEQLGRAYEKIRGELSKVIVGQEEVIELLLISLFSRGHCILEGVPGLAKTLLISSLARCLSLSFSRIQFTPDLMPSDITGTEVIEEDKGTGMRSLRFVQGPIFANVVLADEINRTPPKTQAALLEAMQEHQVTAAGYSHKLPKPFYVLATQNPIEQEGTYPLPEAQLDRFKMKVLVSYPSEKEEFEIIRTTTADEEVTLERTLNAKEVMALQATVRRVPCADHVIRYAMRLVRATRVSEGDVPDIVRQYVAWGAGPRASQDLVMTAKARAILKGRFFVATEDIIAMAKPVLRHRVLTNFSAEADGVRPDDILEQLVKTAAADPSSKWDDRVARRVFAEPTAG